MNAERLKAIVDFLVEKEDTARLQALLDALMASLNNQVSANVPQHQTDTASRLAQLETTFQNFLAPLSPAQMNSIAEIKGALFFGAALTDEIKQWFAENAMTPAVAQQKLQKLIDDRQKYVALLRSTKADLDQLGIQAETLQSGQAELGVLLPRELFRNELEGLQRELKTLSSIIRTFYELANVTPGPIEIHQISTSDPVFFLGIDVGVLVDIGRAVKWCIDVIKAGYDLKKIVETMRAATVSPHIIKSMEGELKKQIDQKVEEKVAALLAGYQGDAARRNELQKPVHMALDQLLQRLERGVVIEIRAIAPLTIVGNEPDPNLEKFGEVQEIAKTLEFPKITGEPMLQLTDEQAPTKAHDTQKPS